MGLKWREADINVAGARAALRLAALTPREREVLEGVVRGNSNKQIAYNLGISVRTVENHRAHMMRCLGARHVAELVRLIMAVSGWLNQDRRI